MNYKEITEEYIRQLNFIKKDINPSENRFSIKEELFFVYLGEDEHLGINPFKKYELNIKIFIMFGNPYGSIIIRDSLQSRFESQVKPNPSDYKEQQNDLYRRIFSVLVRHSLFFVEQGIHIPISKLITEK